MEISLALGGGGVKGNAHIGVLRVLEQNKFQIRAIAGTSAGGLWGSLYAVGYSPDEIESRVSQLYNSQMFRRFSGEGPAVFGLNGVAQLLQSALGDCTFEQLRIPFAVTAVDLETGQRLSLNRGRVLDAVLATIAVPGIFPPRLLDGRVLIDGGVLDPVPVNLARTLAPGLPVVAVVLSPPITAWSARVKPKLLASLPFLGGYLERSRFAQAMNIFLRSIDMSGALLTDQILRLEQPEIVIRPEVREIGFLDPVNVAEVARRGEDAAREVLPELRRLFSWRSRLTSKLSRRRYPVHWRRPSNDA